MTQLVEGMLTIVKGLSARERTELIEALLASGALTPDQQDALVIARRRGGRRRPLEAFVRDLRRQGRVP